MLIKCPNIEFNMGLIDIESIHSSQNILLILDDLTYKCEKDETIQNNLQLIHIIKLPA